MQFTVNRQDFARALIFCESDEENKLANLKPPPIWKFQMEDNGKFSES